MRILAMFSAFVVMFAVYPLYNVPDRSARLSVSIEYPLVTESAGQRSCGTLGSELLPSRLPSGVRLVEFREETWATHCSLWAIYDFDDLILLGAPHGPLYGPRGRQSGPWDGGSDGGGLLFRFLRFHCRSYNCLFWYTIHPEEEEARLAGTADPKTLRRNLAERLSGARIALRLKGPGKLVESNGERMSENECVWKGTYPSLLEKKEGTTFSTIGVFAARYYVFPPWTMWLAAAAFMAIVWFGWGFWLQWMLASTMGMVLGGILLALAQDLAGAGVNSGDGAVHGAAVGTMQWLVLRGQVSRAGWWVPATIVGWTVGLAVAWQDPRVFVGLTLHGAAVGTMQWLVLRQKVSLAGLWVLVSIVGWTTCYFVIAAVGYGGSLALGEALGGALGAAITGILLVWLLRHSVAET